MSIRVSVPGLILSEFQCNFHHDFPYDSSRRLDHVILESFDGVRFHFPLQDLINASTVFADASKVAHNDGDFRPIVIFASTYSLHYFLMVLRQPYSLAKKQIKENSPLTATPETTVDTIRIAHMLEAPSVGRKIVSQGRLDVYLRFVIERTLDEQKPMVDDLKHPISRRREPADISFSPNPHDRFQRSLTLVQEINPSATSLLVRFHQDRQNAMSDLKEWWSTGIPTGRVLRSDRPPQTLHHQSCEMRFMSGHSFAEELPRVVPTAMIALAKSKTKIGRAKNVKAILSGHANGCKGCLARLRGSLSAGLAKLQFEVSDDTEMIAHRGDGQGAENVSYILVEEVVYIWESESGAKCFGK